MFDAEARVAAGSFALEAFVDAEHDIDGHVAISVDADLPAGVVGFAGSAKEFRFGGDENAEVAGAARVGLGKASGALGNGTVAGHLHGADADPFIAETGADAGGDHLIDVS